MTAKAEEIEALRRPFRTGLLGVVALIVLVGGLIAAFGTGANRAEGVAERWLAAVGDTTRTGVRSDAERRLGQLGGAGLVSALVPPGATTGGKRAFLDFEVAKAQAQPDGSRLVAFRVRRRDGVAEASEATGALVLRRAADRWQVDELVPAGGNRLPSDGGPALAQAPLGAYAGAILLGLLVTVACSALVRRAGAHESASR